MPGRIIKILAGDDDAVEEGQAVLILEAMKMQNEIKSPQKGRIARIGPKPGGGEVRIEVRKTQQRVEISVKDNGVGIDKASKTSGFGLYSVKERLQLKYGNRGRFQIFERSGGGAEVVMEIPCED